MLNSTVRRLQRYALRPDSDNANEPLLLEVPASLGGWRTFDPPNHEIRLPIECHARFSIGERFVLGVFLVTVAALTLATYALLRLASVQFISWSGLACIGMAMLLLGCGLLLLSLLAMRSWDALVGRPRIILTRDSIWDLRSCDQPIKWTDISRAGGGGGRGVALFVRAPVKTSFNPIRRGLVPLMWSWHVGAIYVVTKGVAIPGWRPTWLDLPSEILDDAILVMVKANGGEIEPSNAHFSNWRGPDREDAGASR